MTDPTSGTEADDVPAVAVVDTSPIVYLVRVGHLALLELVARRIVVTGTVVGELGRGAHRDAQLAAVAASPWLERVDSPAVPPVFLEHGLHPGEAATLAWALARPGTLAVVDDMAGRRCAGVVGVPVRGVLGVVLQARREGRIARARPILEAMRSEGMHLKVATMDASLRLIGE